MILSETLKLEKAMANAENYAEWSKAAKAHDVETRVEEWKLSDESKYFDSVSIRRRLERLSKFWKSQNNAGLLYALNEGIHGNIDGMGHERLHRKAKFGTKKLIQQYIDTITISLNYLASNKVKDIPFEDKLDFFRRAQHCFGRSALLISGSGAFMYFHFGVVKALWEQGLVPQVISGSSGGAFVGAILATHTEDQISKFFEPEYLDKIINNIDDDTVLKTADQAITREQRREVMAAIIPDLTFQEAYELTGRHLNISVAPAEQHQTSRLLNAVASPNVYICDAIMASCAVPGVYEPVTLAAKDHRGQRVPYLPNRKWVDGSVTDDLPAKRLARLYGCNHFIVSQANPHIAAFASDVKQQRGAFDVLRQATTKITKAWINAAATIYQRPLRRFPRLNSAVNIGLSVINQDYTGDINIIRPALFWPISKMIGKLPIADIEFLIDLGERTTWPKIEMVRSQTNVSQTLERILFEYEDALSDDHRDAKIRKIA